MSCEVTGSNLCRCDRTSKAIVYEKYHSLKDLLRKLFTDHAVYTKFYIESALSDQPDLTSIANRLFENQVEIGTNIGNIVGHKNGEKLTDLLKKHIEAAANAVTIAKKGGNLTDAKSKIFANSAQVAKFLSDICPNHLQYQRVKKEFDHHNVYVLEMVTLHLKHAYDQEVIKFDEYYNHMLMFSDMLYVALSSSDEYYTYGSSVLLIVVLLLFIYLFVMKRQ